MFSTDDTIVAIATPPGRGGIGVVRISGASSRAIAARLLDRRRPLEPRHATLAKVVSQDSDPVDRERTRRASDWGGELIDQVIATYFPAPNSYTGEDVVEISGHGSPVLLQAVVRAALAAGARLAEPGEFTLRAFLHGRIDLVQAEAIADLIDAVTPQQARAAFDQLEGSLTGRISVIHQQLFELIASLEASLDFPEEGYHFAGPSSVAASAREVLAAVSRLLQEARQGRAIREGRQVAILGKTNVGKSSIFNSLTGYARAIVTSVHGTTRDLVTELADVGGIPVRLIDTAGIRETEDEVEVEGVARARAAKAIADLVLLVVDRSRPLDAEDLQLLQTTSDRPRLVVINKIDLPASWHRGSLAIDGIEISTVTSEGLDDLRHEIARALGVEEELRDAPAITNVRHVRSLEQCAEALRRAGEAAADGASEEFVLADLQSARQILEEITGRRTTDDLLAHIFQRFCIGK